MVRGVPTNGNLKRPTSNEVPTWAQAGAACRQFTVYVEVIRGPLDGRELVHLLGGDPTGPSDPMIPCDDPNPWSVLLSCV